MSGAASERAPHDNVWIRYSGVQNKQRNEKTILLDTLRNPRPLGHSDVARRQVTACASPGRTGPSLLGPASGGVKPPERAAVDRR